MQKILLGITAVLLLFSSCRTNKDLIYLQDIGADMEEHKFSVPNEDYKVQKYDVLYIRVYSMNQEINNLFNPGMANQNTNQQMNQSNLYFQGYVVNDSGFVKMPIIGLVDVLDKTEENIEKEIEIKVNEYVKDVNVLVKLAGMKVTILGEVKNPGMHYLYQKEATIFDALAIANDLNDYGNRENILVVRATSQGTVSYRVNLMDKSLLTSPAFYLQPNDMIYIEPVETKGIRLVAQDYATYISAITTTLTAISSTITAIVLINSLVTP